MAKRDIGASAPESIYDALDAHAERMGRGGSISKIVLRAVEAWLRDNPVTDGEISAVRAKRGRGGPRAISNGTVRGIKASATGSAPEDSRRFAA